MKAVTMSRSTSWRFTSDLMGRDVSLLANLRISSTERNNSSPSFAETGMISRYRLAGMLIARGQPTHTRLQSGTTGRSGLASHLFAMLSPDGTSSSKHTRFAKNGSDSQQLPKRHGAPQVNTPRYEQ